MRLALHTDYGLRTLLYLAAKPGRANVAQVADFFQISKDHVAKVVQSLARLGYMHSIAALAAESSFLKRPDQIRVGQVILDFEGNMNLLECVSVDNVCVIQPGCRLRTVLAKAEQMQMDYLKSVRLSDIVVPGGQLLEITGGTIGVIEI